MDNDDDICDERFESVKEEVFHESSLKTLQLTVMQTEMRGVMKDLATIKMHLLGAILIT